MIERYWKENSIDDEGGYVLDGCNNCNFYPCERIREFKRYVENHYNFSCRNSESNFTIKVISTEKVVLNTNLCSVMETDSDKRIVSYDQEHLKSECIMSQRFVVQIECGSETVIDGIGEHYKIKLDWEHKIRKGICDRWEPSQPVFISAQTGQGKNYFIENALIPYVHKINYEHRTKQKVLISRKGS